MFWWFSWSLNMLNTLMVIPNPGIGFSRGAARESFSPFLITLAVGIGHMLMYLWWTQECKPTVCTSIILEKVFVDYCKFINSTKRLGCFGEGSWMAFISLSISSCNNPLGLKFGHCTSPLSSLYLVLKFSLFYLEEWEWQ